MKIKIILSGLLLISITSILVADEPKKLHTKTFNFKQEIADQFGIAAFGAIATIMLKFPKFTTLSILPFLGSYCAITLDKRDQETLKTYPQQCDELNKKLEAIKQQNLMRKTATGQTIEILTMPISMFTPIAEMRKKIIIEKQQEQLEKCYQAAYNRQIATPNIVGSMAQPYNVDINRFINPW